MSFIVESTWYGSGQAKCNGPPSVIKSYLDPMLSGDTMAISSPFYGFVNNEYLLGQCGFLFPALTRGCCYSSLDLQSSNGTISTY